MAEGSLDADLLVAGGGPTGLAAAIHAAKAGLEPVVVEPRPGVIDKACGEGLMPGAVATLEALGVLLPVGHPLTGVRYVDHRDPARCAEGRFPDRPGLGLRRTALHAALRAEAEHRGVRWCEGRVRAVRQTPERVEAAGLRARWLLGADGLHSDVARAAGIEARRRHPPRYGARRHFRTPPWTDRVEVHWSPRAEAYVTPVAEDLVGVAVLFGRPGRYGELLADFPHLRARLGRPVTEVRGAGPFERRPTRRVAGRVLLVGDAAGYLDPLTGEGVALGALTAREAVECLRAGRPESYEARWRRVTRRYRLPTEALLALARHQLGRQALIPTLRRIPGLFEATLSVLGGEPSSTARVPRPPHVPWGTRRGRAQEAPP